MHFRQRLGEYPVESGMLVMIASSFDRLLLGCTILLFVFVQGLEELEGC